MFNGKKKKQLLKIQNFKFNSAFNGFGRDHPYEYTWILGSESDVYFPRMCHLKRLLPWSNTREKEKDIVKNRKFKMAQFFEKLC